MDLKTCAAIDDDAKSAGLKYDLGDNERKLVISALEANNWSIQITANSLKVCRKTLWEKMKKYDISKPF